MPSAAPVRSRQNSRSNRQTTSPLTSGVPESSRSSAQTAFCPRSGVDPCALFPLARTVVPSGSVACAESGTTFAAVPPLMLRPAGKSASSQVSTR